MLSKTTRFEILLEAGPDALVGISQRVRRILAGHEVDCLPVNITLSRHIRGVLLDHGGA